MDRGRTTAADSGLVRIRLASLDMAGTTIDEGGTVYRVLRDAIESATGRSVPDSLLSAWSGTDKSEAIHGLLDALGEDATRTEAIFASFSEDLAVAYETRAPVLLPGVREAVASFREDGIAVALQTGYVRDVAERLLEAVRWRVGDDIDALVTAEDVPRSRPAPYLVFRSMEATGVLNVRDVLVAGDTVNDLTAGTRAGAGIVAGVLTGAHTATTLGAVAHTHIVPSVADLPELVRSRG